MKKSIVINLHTGYWIIYLLFHFYELANNSASGQTVDVVRLVLFPLISAIICFYSFYFVLIPNFLAKKRVSLFVLYGIVIGIALSLIELLIQTSQPKPSINNVLNDSSFIAIFISTAIFILINSFLILINGFIATLLWGFITWYEEIHVKELLKNKNLQTELALIKAQINPHFLFNTLHNIDVLIEKNSEAASAYLKKLSDIMRFMLYDTPNEKVPLSKELEFIEKYIALQSLRTSNEEFIVYKVTGEGANFFIHPMILVPFVENAFKHSTNKKIKEAIFIEIEISQDKIHFLCRNVINTEKKATEASNSGLGMELIKHRLDLLYKRNYDLKIQQNKDYFEVRLTINSNAY